MRVRVSSEFHLGFFPVSCRVSYKNLISGVLNVQMGFFRVSLGFHVGFIWCLFGVSVWFSFRVSFKFKVSLGFHLEFLGGFSRVSFRVSFRASLGFYLRFNLSVL